MLCSIGNCRHILAVIALLSVLRHQAETDAMPLTGVVPETSEYMRILHHGGDFFLAGAKNALYNVSARTMAVQAEYRWLSSLEANDSCKQDIVFFENDCNSYVRMALQYNESYYLVCASSAKTPACRPLTLTQQGDWVLGEELNGDVSIPRQAYAPIFPSESSVTYVTDEKTVYAATTYYYDAQPYHILFRNAGLSPDGTAVKQMTSANRLEYINQDSKFGIKPEFISTFETRDHVYTIYTEPALETYNLLHQKSVYSRIARVCKNDMGASEDEHIFMTLFKARLLCGLPEVSDGKGSYPFYFDEVASVSQPHKSSRTGEEIILAVFNSPRNSVRGSAICEFKVADIEKTFDESPQMKLTGNEADGYVWQARTLVGRPPAKCPENTHDLRGEELEKSKHPLLRDRVKPINDVTLFTQSNVDYRMTQLLVDWHVNGSNNRSYDIIFVSTDDGQLLKLVEYTAPGDSSLQYHLVEKRRVFRGKAIREMEIVTDSDGNRHILLNTYDEMKRVALEKCHNHASCSSCLDARDPYCSWSLEKNSCVSNTHAAKDKFQNIATGTDDRCQNPKETTGKSSVSHVAIEPGTTPPGGVKVKGVSASKQEGSGSVSAAVTGLIVGIVLCSLIFAFVGFFLGVYYNQRKGRTITRHLDRLSKNKEDLYKADTDAYQTMPNLTKSNNIVYQNNLSVKLQNGGVDSMALPNGGESTLQRHKKSYV